MRYLSTLVALALLGSSGLAVSQAVPRYELNGKLPACMSEDLLDEMIQAVLAKDEIAFEDVMRRGCLMPKAHTHVLLLDRSIMGWSKVRAYSTKGSVVLYVQTEGMSRAP